MTEVERFDDASGEWVAIDYGSFEIEFGVSDILIAPTAAVTVARTSPVAAGERIRVREDGATTFEGRVQRTKPRTQGPMRVEAEHDAHALFDDTVDLSVSGTDEDVLDEALSQASGTWTLDYVGTATTLGDPYEVEGRSIKRVFRDMTERVGRVWWVGVDNTITVAEYGAGGQLASVDTATDDVVVDEYTPADVETVINDVTVVGTGGEKVTGSASDSGSISEYGRQPERLNVSYIRSTGEADDYASEVLNPEPDAAASVRVGASVGPVASPVVNQTLAVTDTQGTGMDEELVIEKQVVQQGVADLDLGEGAGTNVETFNRREKSKGDVTEPGSVYNTDRIADDAINSDKLEADAVTVSELADQAVTADKIFPGAVVEGALADDAVSTAKVQTSAITEARLADSAVSTAKIAQAAINGDKIQTGAVGTTKLFVADWIPIGLSFTDDDPGAGDISWNAHQLVYNGNTYDISAGDSQATYVYWQEGDTSYSTAGVKPSLGPNDALVAINDDGEANQILQATSIHGGSIVTNTIDAAEIRAGAITASEIDAGAVEADKIAAGAITADKIDVLDLDTDQLTVGSGLDGGWEFGTDSIGTATVATLEPFGDGALIGTDFDRPDAYFSEINVDNITMDQSISSILPSADDEAEVGSSTRAFTDMYAYNFIDASTGSAINDGGDPLAGLADGHGPPDHAKVTDEDGAETGYSLNDMARGVWDVVRAQQSRIETLEARLDTLEDAVDPNA